MFSPHIETLILIAEKPKHDATLRVSLRCLESMRLPHELDGRLADMCFNHLLSSTCPVAPKAYCMGILVPICKRYPDLAKELKLVLEQRFHHETSAFQGRARIVSKKLGFTLEPQT